MSSHTEFSHLEYYHGLVWPTLYFLDNPLTYTYTFHYTLLVLYPKPKLTYRLNNFIHPSASEE